ncbi:hypothetical protein SLEP1_g46110 [Rubroshorea leprosula]|uniref:Uncharacterized protein n=1 Tax=Rubroshorea leprosula TaxID=152421 RepID=A0AAV5LNR7_9ROSI|nr:hypothetical protein SLEP1_g46110 [Rubroshorea leprosula]
MGEAPATITKEDVIAKLKDDGDFDRLRLKIIRNLKQNEELRDNIIAVVKQSAALNRSDAENMKPRQLLDAIFDEVGDKVMGQISDGLWDIIRSEGGMKSEITETVQSVYDKLVTPQAQRIEGESSNLDVMPVKMEADQNGFSIRKASADGVDDMLSDGEPNEPPGFSLSNNHRGKHQQEQQLPLPYQNGTVEEQKEDLNYTGNVQEQDNVDSIMPLGFSADMEDKQPCNDSDEDPEVPPGFG